MKDRLLDFLVCPHCKGPVEVEAGAREEDGEIMKGALRCRSCGLSFPIERGIPRFLSREIYMLYEETKRNFAFSWEKFAHIYEDPRDFLDWISPLDKSFFKDKIVLDAGCGTGKHAVFASQFGAREVIAFDLSPAVDVAFSFFRPLANVHVVQADIYHLPFKQDFDHVYSIGVLQHLPEPERGFRNLSGLLKKGGWCSIWVYGYEGTGMVRTFVDPVRRAITSKMPLSQLYVLSFIPAAVIYALAKGFYPALARGRYGRAFLVALPLASYMQYMSQFDFTYLHNSVFDQLVAPITHYFRRSAIEAWYKRAGLKQVTITARNEMSWRSLGRKL